MVMMNALAFVLCLCAIFLPSMPIEDGNQKKSLFLLIFSRSLAHYFLQYARFFLFFLCCFNGLRLFTLYTSFEFLLTIHSQVAVCMRVLLCIYRAPSVCGMCMCAAVCAIECECECECLRVRAYVSFARRRRRTPLHIQQLAVRRLLYLALICANFCYSFSNPFACNFTYLVALCMAFPITCMLLSKNHFVALHPFSHFHVYITFFFFVLTLFTSMFALNSAYIACFRLCLCLCVCSSANSNACYVCVFTRIPHICICICIVW